MSAHPDADVPATHQRYACSGGDPFDWVYHSACSRCMDALARQGRVILVAHGATWPAGEWMRHPVRPAALVELSDGEQVEFAAYQAMLDGD